MLPRPSLYTGVVNKQGTRRGDIKGMVDVKLCWLNEQDYVDNTFPLASRSYFLVFSARIMFIDTPCNIYVLYSFLSAL